MKLYDGKDWYDIANERKEHSGWKCEICGTESDFEYICGECTRQDDKCNNCFITLNWRDPDHFDLDFHNFYKQKSYFGLICHERFEYDITKHEQKLVGLIVLCKLCHHVKHIRRAEYLASTGTLDMKTVIDLFMKVNDCGIDIYKQHRADAEEEYKRRSKLPWDIYFGEYAAPKLKYFEWRELIRLHPNFGLRDDMF